ncbi:MAG: hypothetical protein ACKVP7_13965 [Hyphomicrobiaceae bacterium]
MRPDRDPRITAAQREVIRQLGERLRGVGRLRGHQRGIFAEAGEIVEKIAAAAARGENIDVAIAHARDRITALEMEVHHVAERPWDRAERLLDMALCLMPPAVFYFTIEHIYRLAYPADGFYYVMFAGCVCGAAMYCSSHFAKALLRVARRITGSQLPSKLQAARTVVVEQTIE